MRIGNIIDFSYQGHKKWVVVSVNDCRACIVPLANRNPDDPSAVFEESDSGATGISPNSSCPILGRVKGQIKTRSPIVYTKVVSPVQTTKPLPSRKLKPVIKPESLPPVPEDPCPDPMMSAIITATCQSPFGVTPE